MEPPPAPLNNLNATSEAEQSIDNMIAELSKKLQDSQNAKLSPQMSVSDIVNHPLFIFAGTAAGLYVLYYIITRRKAMSDIAQF